MSFRILAVAGAEGREVRAVWILIGFEGKLRWNSESVRSGGRRAVEQVVVCELREV